MLYTGYALHCSFRVTIASTRGTILKPIFTQWDFLFNNNNYYNNMLETYSVAFSIYIPLLASGKKRKEREKKSLNFCVTCFILKPNF